MGRDASEPKEIGGLLVEAARVGERILLEAEPRGGLHERTKSGWADLVTDMDLRVQEGVVGFLKSRIPGVRIVAEEAPGPQPEAEAIFVDPIDGTLNFVHGIGEYGISIGYWAQGQPQAGVVLKPSSGDLFTAQRGLGAFRNGQPIRVSQRATLRDALLSTGWPYDKGLAGRVLGQMGALIGRCQEIRIIGSAALALCYVASGVLDGFWETGLEPWDLAAGTVIALEAGAALTTQDGGLFRLERGEILVSNGSVHQEMVTLLTHALTSGKEGTMR